MLNHRFLKLKPMLSSCFATVLPFVLIASCFTLSLSISTIIASLTATREYQLSLRDFYQNFISLIVFMEYVFCPKNHYFYNFYNQEVNASTLCLSIFYVSLSANIFPGNLVSSMLENKSVSAGWCAAGRWEVGYLMIVVLFANKSRLLHFIANAILLGDGGLFLD